MIEMFCVPVEALSEDRIEEIKQVDYLFYRDLEEDSFDYEEGEEWILLIIDEVVRGYVCLFPHYWGDNTYSVIRLLNINEAYRKYSSIFLRFMLKICQEKNSHWQCSAKQNTSLKLLKYLQKKGVINLIEEGNIYSGMYIPTYFTFN